MKLVVGVTGGIGSGKSALTDRLAAKGITVVDADIVAREVVEPGRPALDEIRHRFGDHVIQADGSLDRAALRHIVFADESARLDLEGITHPRIRDAITHQLKEASSPYVILSSPLLLESGQVTLVDKVVVVDVPESAQIERTMARDDNDETLVRRIMAAQASRAQRQQAADFLVDNSDSLAALDQRAEALHQSLLEISSQ